MEPWEGFSRRRVMCFGRPGISFGKGLKEKSGTQSEEGTSLEYRHRRPRGTINHKP
jgi:hypothetical protein